jgi:hypothetical protein
MNPAQLGSCLRIGALPLIAAPMVTASNAIWVRFADLASTLELFMHLAARCSVGFGLVSGHGAGTPHGIGRCSLTPGPRFPS